MTSLDRRSNPGRQKRLFRGLREPPDDVYDAVVIGAGIGGLFCATKLALEGLRVLIAEQHYMVGGYCSTFRRKGYTFDAATHFYPLLGNPSTITGKIITELGIETDWVKMDPVDTFHFPDGSRFTVPPDLEDYRAKLDAEFPHEKHNLDRYFDAVRETYLKGLLCYFRGRDTRWLGEWQAWTVRRALDHFFDDRKLKLLLTADCPHWGSPPSRTSFVFDSMLRLSYFLGNYYPVGGSQAFSDALARRFEELGGHVLTSTRAEEILIDGRGSPRVRGVRLNTTRGPLRGVRTVAADRVVSNADLKLTFGRLVDERWVDPALRRQLETLRPSWPCFLTHLGLRDVDAAALERVQGYYWTSWDPDRMGRDGVRCKVFAPTLYEPRMAPEGGQIVILQKVLEIDGDDSGGGVARKAAFETSVTRHLASLLPGLGDRIVVQTSASANTARRFTWNEAGAMLGWEMSPDQLGEHRPGIESGIDGLFLAGHWVRPGGGVTPVIISAMQAAEAVVRGRVPGLGERRGAQILTLSGLAEDDARRVADAQRAAAP